MILELIFEDSNHDINEIVNNILFRGTWLLRLLATDMLNKTLNLSTIELNKFFLFISFNRFDDNIASIAILIDFLVNVLLEIANFRYKLVPFSGKLGIKLDSSIVSIRIKVKNFKF